MKPHRCTWHARHDEEGQPTGEPCNAIARWAVIWPDSRQWSPACESHKDDIAPGAPRHFSVPIADLAHYLSTH